MIPNGKRMAPSLSELLAHAAWTRQLARSLVGDAAADDVVQDTWIAAMRQPPDTSRPLRPWLGTVVRRNVFNRARERQRRETREAHVDVVAAPESAEAQLGRLELHKALVEVVGQLAEPYRRMILLAYFDGLTSAEIGARESLPAGTVRGRLKTAVELLREALDRRFASREAWLFPLTELAFPSTRAPGAGPAGGGSHVRAPGAPAAVGGASALPMTAVVIAVAVIATIGWGVHERSRRAVELASRRGSPTKSAPRATSPRAPFGGGATNDVRRAPSAIFGDPVPSDPSGGAAPVKGLEAAVFGIVTVGGPEASRAAPRVSAGGRLSGAAIRIVGGLAAQPAPPRETTLLTFDAGGLLPRIQVARVGQPLAVLNGDEVPRTVGMRLGGAVLFDRTIPGREQSSAVEIPNGRDVIEIDSGARARPTAFVVPTDNDFHDVTNAKGTFELRGVPPGRYTLEAWDAELGTRTVEVVVPTQERILRFSYGAEVSIVAGVSGGCTITKGVAGPVAKACAEGGVSEAKKVMKKLVKEATVRGRKFTCDGCHRELDSFALLPDARKDLEAMLAVVAGPR